jgi:hypothetical protein
MRSSPEVSQSTWFVSIGRELGGRDVDRTLVVFHMLMALRWIPEPVGR